jgi:ribosome biogenesis protein Nip4
MNVLTDIIEKDNVKLRVKPQEMIKLYDNLLEYENQLINLEKENPDQSYLIDLNFRNKVYSVSKIFYVGLFYLLNKKYEDVYTIMHHILEKIKEINEFYENHNLSSISFLRELRAFIENLENLVRFIISKSYVKMAQIRKLFSIKLIKKFILYIYISFNFFININYF